MLTRGAVLAAGLQVGAVAADPDDDRLAAGAGGPQRDRVDAAGVDLLQPLADDLLQAAGLGDAAGVPALAAEVELGQPVDPAAGCRRRSRRARPPARR